MSKFDHEYIVHTVKDNNKNTKVDLQTLSEYLNAGFEIMTTFSDGKNDSYFLLYRHQHKEESKGEEN